MNLDLTHKWFFDFHLSYGISSLYHESELKGTYKLNLYEDLIKNDFKLIYNYERD